jgi:hypothetical protein
MRGKTSHVELDQEFADHLGGKIVRVHAFLTWRKALEAAGLRDYPGPASASDD